MSGVVRAVILAATIAALIAFWLEPPAPVKPSPVETKYCKVMYWRWAEMFGRKVKYWYEGFGPCSLMDRYEEA